MVEFAHCWVEFLRFTSFTFLQCTYRWSHHRPQDNPPIWLFPHRSRDHPPFPHMTSPPLTPPLYIPFPYSSLQFFSTSSLLPLSPHLSQDHPPVTRPPTQMTIPPLTLPLYISFYTPLYSSKPPLWPVTTAHSELRAGINVWIKDWLFSYHLLQRKLNFIASPQLYAALYN